VPENEPTGGKVKQKALSKEGDRYQGRSLLRSAFFPCSDPAEFYSGANRARRVRRGE